MVDIHIKHMVFHLEKLESGTSTYGITDKQTVKARSLFNNKQKSAVQSLGANLSKF